MNWPSACWQFLLFTLTIWCHHSLACVLVLRWAYAVDGTLKIQQLTNFGYCCISSKQTIIKLKKQTTTKNKQKTQLTFSNRKSLSMCVNCSISLLTAPWSLVFVATLRPTSHKRYARHFWRSGGSASISSNSLWICGCVKKEEGAYTIKQWTGTGNVLCV